MENRSAAAPIYVGIFVVLGTVVFLFLSLRAGDSERVSNPRRVVVDFAESKGLAVGADVRYLGVRVGLVDDISLADREGTTVARVSMNVDSAVAIKEDAVAAIVPSTLLGNFMVNFEGGTSAAADATPERPILGKEEAGLNEVIEKIGDGIDEVKKLAGNLDENQKNVFEKLEAVIDENRDNIKEATDSLAEVGPKLTETIDKLKGMVDEADSGEGTIGKLLKDTELYDRIDTVSKDVAKITDQIASGEGTMGKLVFTEEGLADIKDSLKEMQAAFEDIREVLNENRTSITEAVDSLKGIGPSVDEAATNLREITDKINSGEGTLGKFVNDDSLYVEAKEAFNQIQQTFEEAEEQTVLQSFLRIFTGAI